MNKKSKAKGWSSEDRLFKVYWRSGKTFYKSPFTGKEKDYPPIHGYDVLKPKCRHRKTWIVAYGNVEWCYQCGALRSLSGLRMDGNKVSPVSVWACPVGDKSENPWNEWERKSDIYRKKEFKKLNKSHD